MKKLITFIAFMALLILLLSSCRSNYNPYWSKVKKTEANGKLNFYSAGWPRKSGCTGIYPTNPTKQSTMKRYHYWRKSKRN